MSCFYLAYVSTARERFRQEELESLLSTCRENNAALGISGVLVYAEGSFMQLIEGDEEDVRDLYARIQQDPRHHNLIVLDEGETSDREFGDWSMAFHDLSGRMDEVDGFEDLMAPLQDAESSNTRHLRRLVQSARRSLKETL